MDRILFSPIGGTDPISNCRDGAMLHICRRRCWDFTGRMTDTDIV